MGPSDLSALFGGGSKSTSKSLFDLFSTVPAVSYVADNLKEKFKSSMNKITAATIDLEKATHSLAHLFMSIRSFFFV